MTIQKYVCNFHTPGTPIRNPDSPCPIYHLGTGFDVGRDCWDCKYLAISIKDNLQKKVDPEPDPDAYAINFLTENPEFLEID